MLKAGTWSFVLLQEEIISPQLSSFATFPSLMADFLGSYYDSIDLYGSDIDEKIISQRMAILSLEQPVSIMDMENLEASKGKGNGRDIFEMKHNVDQLHTSSNGCDLRTKFSVDTNLDEDLDIPVASMSTFEQGQNSMVSVQLISAKGDDFRGRQVSNIRNVGGQTVGNATKELEGMLSPVSQAAATPQSGVRITRGTLQDKSAQKEATVQEGEAKVDEKVDARESQKPFRRNSIFRFLSRRKK